MVKELQGAQMKIYPDTGKMIVTSTLVLVLFSAFLVIAVNADVPSVLEINASTQNGNTILLIKIRHSNPRATHYVDMIEIDVDGEITKVAGIEPQDTQEFEYEYNLGEIGEDAKVKVRAHCNLHGWSSWYEVEQDEGDGGIPGFPWEALTIGILGASYPLVKRRLKKTRK